MHTLKKDVVDGICTVTFWNPPRGLMNNQMVVELNALADEIRQDDSIAVVIFQGGTNGVFIRHYDMAELVGMADALIASGIREDDPSHARARLIDVAFKKIETLPQITIAAINGYCMGGGLEFACCCDIRIANEGRYRIGLPEVKGGIFPGAGGTQRLAKVIGEAKALNLILRGLLLDPAEAKAAGIVSDVAADVVARARDIARGVQAHPGGALGAQLAKALVRGAASRSIDEGLEMERRAIVRPFRSPEIVAAMREFAEQSIDPTEL